MEHNLSLGLISIISISILCLGVFGGVVGNESLSKGSYDGFLL